MKVDYDWLKIEMIQILDETIPISKAITLLQEGHDIVIITDEDSKYKGLIRTRDIIGKAINLTALCKTYLNKNVPVLTEKSLKGFSPKIIGEMMNSSGTRYIPLLDDFSKVKGAFKDSMILSKILSSERGHDHITIKEAVNWDLVFLNEKDNIGTAIALFRECDFSRIPVMNSLNEFEGLIIDRDLLRKHLEKRATLGDIGGDRDKDWHQLPVIDFLCPMEFISLDDSLLEVADKFIKENKHSLFVKDDKIGYGIVTALDIIHFLLVKSTTTGLNVFVQQAPDEDIHNHTIRKSLNIMEREQEWLGSNCTMKIRFKRNLSQSKRGQFSITSSIRLNSGKGYSYHTEVTDFGAEKTVNRALDKMARIISNDKKRALTQRDRSFSIRKRSEYE